MRIITGRARGAKLYTLDGEQTRPTAERVKEAIFSMIQFAVEGREVLDLFGGSGQMALEAVSRGAAHATVCDSNDAACDVIRKNVEKTRMGDDVTLIRADYVEALRQLRCGRPFDLVFLDPPYNKGMVSSALRLLRDHGLVKPTSLIVCESGGEDIFAGGLDGSYEAVKTAKYGVACVTILKPI